MIRRFLFILGVLTAATLAGAAPASAQFGYLGHVGSAGLGAGQFFDPYGIDSDAAGNLYIADTGNFRIQKLHADGTPFDPPVMWGSAGSGDGQFSKPVAIAVDGLGNVYVADAWPGATGPSNERVQKFDANGNFLTKWGSSGQGAGQFGWPVGIAAHTDTSVDPPQTHVYVADHWNNRIQEFDADGNFLKTWGSLGFGPGQFRDLWDVRTDAAGNVYTIESDAGGPGGNHRVQKFDKDGNFLSQFDVKPAPDTSECYRRLAVDSAGRVYVYPECVGANALRIFSPTGQLLQTFTCSLNTGNLLGIDHTGKIYMNGLNNGLLIYGEGGGACPNPNPGGRRWRRR